MAFDASSNATNLTMDNTTTLVTDAEGFSPLMRLIFICYYSLIFFLASLGNTLALLTCYKTYKTTTSVLLCYIACLATADLLFTMLSTFDLVYFLLGAWVGGNAVCKIQSFLIETCYTMSVLTLVAISYERLKAVTTPVKARTHRIHERKLIPKLLWCVSLTVCAPLLYAYTVEEEEDGNALCVNTVWGDEARQIYYGIQAVLLLLIPLGIMTCAHVQIFRSLSQHIAARNELFRPGTQDNIRQRKVTKMLALVTLFFAVCYIPFIVVRTLRYLYLYNGNEIWKLVQLLIFTQAAFNPIIYCLCSPQFRLSYKELLRCRFTLAEPVRKPRSSSALSTSSFRIENVLTRSRAPLSGKTRVKAVQSRKSSTPKPVEL